MGLLVYPFSQIVEDVQNDMREKSPTQSATAGSRPIVKRRVNRIYQQEIPSRFEFDFLNKIGNITTVDDYTTGTVTTTVGSTAITGASTVWTSAMTGRKIRFTGADGLYTFTFLTTTTATISPAFAHSGALSAAGYTIFQDTYELEEGFAQMSVEPGFYYEIGTGKQQIRYAGGDEWRRRSTSDVSDLASWWRESRDLSSNGFRQVQLSPPPNSVRLIHYEYEAAPAELREYRSATATIVSTTPTIVTLSVDLSSLLSVGQMFRLDADSTWVRISAVSGNQLTLAESYPSSGSAKACTISDVPKILPPQAHKVLYHGACWETAKDHKDPQIKAYADEWVRALSELMSKNARRRFGLQMARWG